jgi:DNA-binding response OmpR family regulator
MEGMKMKKGKVLMVDDNLDMLLIGQRIFTKAGFEYLSARSGQEGLEKMQSERADAVILDYMLPDLTGLQFIKTVATEAEFAALRTTPVIVLTARTDYLEELDAYYACNLRAVLTKPFGHRELVNVVENMLRLEKALAVHRAAGTTAQAPAAHAPAPLPAAATAGSDLAVSPVAHAHVSNARWADDLRIAATTIARLTSELRLALPAGISEQQCLDLDAVLTSSRRLVRLIDEQFPESEIFQDQTLMA